MSVEGVTGAFRERSDAFLSEADEEFSREGDAWGRAVIGFVRMETAMKAGDVDAALRLGPATAAAFRQLDDLWGLSATLYHFGWGLRQFGRFEEGARVLEEAIDVAAAPGCGTPPSGPRRPGHREGARRRPGDRTASCSTKQRPPPGRSVTVPGRYSPATGTACSLRWTGTGQTARGHYAEAVVGFERLGTPVWVGVSLAGQGRCAEALGELAAAGGHFERPWPSGDSSASRA